MIDRILRKNVSLNAFVRPSTLAAMAGMPPTGPGALSGLVVGVKDNIAVAGQPLTAGMVARAGQIAPRDAHVVALLRAAGAVVLGGLNMDEAALGATTDNPGFGRTLNPLDPARSPGGSSGGPAAAVAAGLVDLALGSDTMGSARIPAAYCGAWGLKPTRGRIGRGGVHPLAPGLDAVGLFARDAAGIGALLSALTGPDPGDPDSRPAPPASAPKPASGLRIGVPDLSAIRCDPVVAAGLARACAALEALGAQLCPLEMRGWDAPTLESAAFLWTEAEGAVALAADFDRSGGISPALGRMLAYGRRVTAAKLVAARAAMAAGTAALDRALAGVDLILTPTTPDTAYLFDTPVPPHQGVFTALASVAGTPALAVPVDVPGASLPGSVQLIGPHWGEAQLLATAGAMAEALAEAF